MFDPHNSDHIKQLTASVKWSKDQMKPFLQTRLDHLAQYTGHLYGEESATDAVPINMIELGVNTMQRFVASHAPQALVGTRYNELLPTANDLELAVNMEADRINLQEAFNTWTHEGLFRLGVLEVGLTTGDTPPDGEGYLFDPGRIFVDPILLDRFIPDMTATSWDLQSYMGHDYTVPFEWMKANDTFDAEVRDKVTAPNREDEDDDETASEEISGSRHGMEEFQSMILLRQLYLPREKLVLTFVVGQEGLGPLKVINWEGPERGPYHPLAYGKVPGNIMPNAPVPQWAPLHDQLNTLWNKVTGQADRQKTVLLVRGSAAADGNRVVESGDGAAIYSEDPSGCVEQSYGGADPKTLATAMQCKDLLDWFAGNLSSLGGLAAQSETFGQDRLLAQNASGKPQDLQKVTITAQKAVFESIAFWLYNDPISEYHIVKQIGNSGESFTYSWGPEERMGDFTKFNFSVDPFSALVQSPSEKLNAYIQTLLQVLVPGEAGMSQQGMGLDWEFVVKTISRLSNQPEVRRSIRFVQGEQYPDGQPLSESAGARMPAATTRTNVRVNRPGATVQGKDQAMISHLLGASPQPAEMAALMRPAG